MGLKDDAICHADRRAAALKVKCFTDKREW